MNLKLWIKRKLKPSAVLCHDCTSEIPFGKSAWLCDRGSRWRSWVCDRCHDKSVALRQDKESQGFSLLGEV